MKKYILLCGLLVVTGAASAQESFGGCLTGFPVEPGSPPFECPPTLHDVLALNERQVERLQEVDFAREDDMFPLLQAQMEKQWELRRHLRGSDPNDGIVTMLFEDMRQIHEDMRRVNAKHRAAAMALLSANQKLALRRLEEAHELQFAAWEAIRFNLIETAGRFPRSASLGSACLTLSVPEQGLSISGAGQTTTPRSRTVPTAFAEPGAWESRACSHLGRGCRRLPDADLGGPCPDPRSARLARRPAPIPAALASPIKTASRMRLGHTPLSNPDSACRYPLIDPTALSAVLDVWGRRSYVGQICGDRGVGQSVQNRACSA